MLLGELKLMYSGAGADNRIFQYVVGMVVAKTEDELRKITAAEADAFKMLSKITEAAEVTIPVETKEESLNMVVEAPKKLYTASVDLKFMELESGATTAAKASI